MAGDWIKMRLDLQTHPKVVRILSAVRPQDVQTRTDKFRVVGGLHAVWSVFDTHSSDGRLHGYTVETLDHIIGWEGFAGAMIAVGWLAVEGPETLVLPEFDEHNGKSGKRRAEDQKRKRNDRKSSESCPHSVRNLSAEEPDEKWTREEKRRYIKEDATASSVDPSDTKAMIFSLGVKILTQSGETDKGARGFLGRFAKNNEQKLAEVIGYLASNPKIDPKAYIAAAMAPKKLEVAL